MAKYKLEEITQVRIQGIFALYMRGQHIYEMCKEKDIICINKYKKDRKMSQKMKLRMKRV